MVDSWEYSTASYRTLNVAKVTPKVCSSNIEQISLETDWCLISATVSREQCMLSVSNIQKKKEKKRK